jgi:hypothetical protein
MPQSLQLPLLCLGISMKKSDDDGKEEDGVVDGNNYYDNYAQCIRESIRLGGCTASRSIYVGAICAALQCHNNNSSSCSNDKLVLGVPEDWVAQLAEPERMKDLAVKIASFK